MADPLVFESGAVWGRHFAVGSTAEKDGIEEDENL